MKSNRHGRVDTGAHWAALAIALAACAGDTLSLGVEAAPQAAPEGSRCTVSPTLVGTVVVNGQADLDALAGCEAIEERFPETRLDEERAAASVLVHCALHDPGARWRAEEFLRESAASVYADRVRSGCSLGVAPGALELEAAPTSGKRR
jgi:hypothetical protein